MSAAGLPNKRVKRSHGYSISSEPDENRYDRLIERLASRRNWRPSEEIDVGTIRVNQKRHNTTEDDDTDIHSIFSIPKQGEGGRGDASPQSAVIREQTQSAPSVLAINDRYSRIEAKSFIASKELSLAQIQDCYELDENGCKLIYRNNDSDKNKYKKIIKQRKCFSYIHFHFVEALKLNMDYARIEQIMGTVSTILKETSSDTELKRLMIVKQQEGVEFPLSIVDPEDNVAWLKKQPVSETSYFVFFRVALQKAIWYSGKLTGTYLDGIIINRVTMKDIYLAFRLRDDSPFAILFHFDIVTFFSGTSPIKPEPLKKSRIWRVITRDEYFGPKQFITHDLGVINFTTLEYRGYYYVYFNNLKMLLENENYKV